ncbi:hypothetical protein CVT25_008840, partial [Psilocybe cyanescens]
ALGQLSEYGVGVCLLLITQLIVAALIVIVLDELLRKGYGIGSSINLFIVTNTCESIVWNACSPTSVNIRRGSEFEGALIALFHLLFTWHDKGQALREAFWRERLPNMMSLVSTVVIFAVVIYLREFRIDIPVKKIDPEDSGGTYPINLFYMRNMLIILQSALMNNVFIVSQISLANLYPSLPLGLQPLEDSPQPPATGGITYSMSPPHTLTEAILNPIHTAIYIMFMFNACALFSKMWIKMLIHDVTRQLTFPFFKPQTTRTDSRITRSHSTKKYYGRRKHLIFLRCSQVPLYGIISSDSSNPLYWMRVILASNRGPLMEPGFRPIITYGMIMQLLIDFSVKGDRALFNAAQKRECRLVSCIFHPSSIRTLLSNLFTIHIFIRTKKHTY